MSGRVELRCGCVLAFREGEIICPRHGRQAVVRTLGMPAPRIRGVATGPHVTPMDLPAWSGPLPGFEKGAE